MNRMLMRFLALAACVLVFAATATTNAVAGEETAGEEAQLLDVSKQVSGIQKKMNELRAHGRWAKPGALLAGADCGYGEPSSMKPE